MLFLGLIYFVVIHQPFVLSSSIVKINLFFFLVLEKTKYKIEIFPYHKYKLHLPRVKNIMTSSYL